MGAQGSSDPPTLAGGSSERVGFLDAPGLGADDLVAQVARVLANMPAGSVLSVHSGAVAAREALARWCEQTGHELVAVIRHDERRTSFTIRT